MGDWILTPAGVAVGIVNAVAGGGSLISFPLFLLLGYSPFVANVSNSVGVFPSNFGGIWGYRHSIKESKRTVAWLTGALVLGTALGAYILLSTGEAVFEAVVPWVILAGATLMALQPYVVRRIAQHEHDAHLNKAIAGTFLIGIYGGYFGPGIGVMLMAVLGAFLPVGLQKVNGFKNACGFANNLLCVGIFAIFADIAWAAALYMALGATVGGFIGTHIAKKLPDQVFRYVVVAIGIAAAVYVAST